MLKYIFIIFSLFIVNKGYSQISKGEYLSLDSALATPDDVIVLDIRYAGLTKLPSEIKNLVNLRIMYLAGNDLESLPPEIRDLQNLEELHLQDNFLSSLPPEIGKLTNLRVLDLPYNKIKSLPKEIFQLKHLEKFDIRSNKMPDSSEAAIRMELPNCQISFNEKELINPSSPLLASEELMEAKVFYSLDEATIAPADVFIIRLTNKQLTNFPSEILSFKNLQALDLSNNKLSSIPKNINQLELLQQLNLRRNRFENLPASLAMLDHLTDLKLGLNRFTKIPDAVWNIKNLKKLDLSFNRSLYNISTGIGKLKNLQKLNLYSCAIQQISPAIGKLKNLQEIDLFGNNISTLPEEISNCSSLEIVILNSNQNLDIMQIVKTLSKCPELKSLDLRNTRISALKRNKIKSYFPNTELIF